MKLIIFLFVSLPLLTMGQKSEILATSTQTAKAQINLAKGLVEGMTSADDIQLSLQNGELSIQYMLPELGDAGRYYELLPIIKLNGEDLLLNPHEALRGDWNQPLTPGAKRLLWINLQSQYVQLEGELEIVLTNHLWGERKLPYDCSKGVPKFSTKQKLPYYIAAGVGAASLGLGQVFRKQSQDIYDNDYLAASTLDDANPLYDDANSKHHMYLTLTYIGATILVADVTLYLIRQRKYKKNKELFDTYCTKPEIGMQSSLDLSAGFVTGGPGLKLNMKF
jgi:hypothetical protein